MAGGSGTRFWPASRKRLPKQFLAIGGKRSLIAETAARLGTLVPPERRLVVRGEEHAAARAQGAAAACRPRTSCASPSRATPLRASRGPRSKSSAARPAPCTPSCRPTTSSAPRRCFRSTLLAAAREARASGALITFGIKPDVPRDRLRLHRRRSGGRATRRVSVHDGACASSRSPTRRARSSSSPPAITCGTRACSCGRRTRSSPRCGAPRPRSSVRSRKPGPPRRSCASTRRCRRSRRRGRAREGAGRARDPGRFRVERRGLVARARGAPAARRTAQRRRRRSAARRGIARDCIAYGKKGQLIALLGVEDLVVVRAGDARARVQEGQRARREGHRRAPRGPGSEVPLSRRMSAQSSWRSRTRS